MSRKKKAKGIQLAASTAQQPMRVLGVPKAGESLYRDYAVDSLFMQLMFGRPDIDQRLRDLGITRADLKKLEGDDEIMAACETRRESVVSTPWHLEPGTGRAVRFIWDTIQPHMDNILRCAWRAVPYGYSVAEAVYQPLEGGRIGLASYIEKPFDWFYPEIDGSLLYRSDDHGIVSVDTTYKFFVTVREQSYAQPYGESLFSRLYSAWFFRTHGWRYWMQFLERVGIPFLLGKTVGDTADMATALQNLVRGGSIAVGVDEDVSLLATTTTGDPFDRFEDRVARRIQKLVLGQTGTTELGATGSYAAVKVQADVKNDRRNADIRMVTRTVNRLIAALWTLNQFNGRPPEFVMEDDTGLQLERAERDLKHYQAGIRHTEQYLLRTYDYEPGDFTIAQEQQEPNMPQPEQNPVQPPEFAAHTCGHAFADGDRFTPEQMAVERLGDDAVAAMAQPINPDAIASAIRSARDPEDLEKRLAVVMAGAQNAEFQRQLERGLFAADIMGYAHAEDRS